MCTFPPVALAVALACTGSGAGAMAVAAALAAPPPARPSSSSFPLEPPHQHRHEASLPLVHASLHDVRGHSGDAQPQQMATAATPPQGRVLPAEHATPRRSTASYVAEHWQLMLLLAFNLVMMDMNTIFTSFLLVQTSAGCVPVCICVHCAYLCVSVCTVHICAYCAYLRICAYLCYNPVNTSYSSTCTTQ